MGHRHHYQHHHYTRFDRFIGDDLLLHYTVRERPHLTLSDKTLFVASIGLEKSREVFLWFALCTNLQ